MKDFYGTCKFPYRHPQRNPWWLRKHRLCDIFRWIRCRGCSIWRSFFTKSIIAQNGIFILQASSSAVLDIVAYTQYNQLLSNRLCHVYVVLEHLPHKNKHIFKQFITSVLRNNTWLGLFQISAVSLVGIWLGKCCADCWCCLSKFRCKAPYVLPQPFRCTISLWVKWNI